ncbi:CoA transferase [Bacillus tianshenii]|uniref:CaiB/BaiF CoA transferase family protein n=1 Tax=Sutcliffiella tianshenii TaxID=1463404 RepID=UPI001CD51FD5|nr:CoA transferase [Bacillus tianshenii]MCA1319129.1 CoA transferase [Bacillus tianshenii]
MIEGMLEGIRVIDFTNYLPGPFASQRLAELGAEIIKIESVQGDPARHTGLKRDGTGIVYLANNRGKKSISVDLKKEGSLEVILGLIDSADVVMESYRPGVMEKLGLDYESVKKRNEKVVYCSITGYGDKGEWSSLGSHDLNYMALSGVLAQLKDKTGRPIHPSITIADYFGSFAACERILAALLSKIRTGKGSYHCISITDVMATMMGNHLAIYEETGEPYGISQLNGEILCYGIYETMDGRFITLAALEEKFWINFCKAIDRPDWKNAQFSCQKESNPVFREMNQLFLSKSFHEWIEFGRQVDCCLSPVLEVGELENFPYFRDKGMVHRTEEGHLEVSMHDASVKGTGKSPSLGEHNSLLDSQVRQ